MLGEPEGSPHSKKFISSRVLHRFKCFKFQVNAKRFQYFVIFLTSFCDLSYLCKFHGYKMTEKCSAYFSVVLSTLCGLENVKCGLEIKNVWSERNSIKTLNLHMYISFPAMQYCNIT